ncbi:amino acid-binding protein [Cellulosilyticum lentocellum]|uniref:Amino acid-binding ACT domain protein n=1 Tax=Cellulosilyticum lentocellum (strain ATCC 49066 / DSM 5427 / NCIMB 11756 / RHM5) TaxID=642492 RepID=F2JPF8_CELLD|nr:amino acid-binding protein [Cellulosilyticum lentocellum]ADZ82506.1 amino acid-binding ACT domain protein [Cellulosilyticum lentocellum DSM 5427]
MIIEQLSVFIENKSGRLYEVMAILGDNDINVSALSIADTSDYGIVRLIVSDPHKALILLKEQAFSVQITPVICCKVPNKPGGLKKMLAYLSEDNISIEYMYAFSIGSDASIILRTESCEKTIESLCSHQMEMMKACDIYQI